MNETPANSRRYMRVVLGLFIAVILAIIIAAGWQYWTRWANP